MTPQSSRSPLQLIQNLLRLTRFTGTGREFWQAYCAEVANLCQAKRAVLLVQAAESWKVAHFWDAEKRPAALEQGMETLAEKTLKSGIMRQGQYLALRLEVGPQEQPPILVLELANTALAVGEHTLYFTASIPSTFQVMRQYGKARQDVIYFAEILKIVGALQEDEKFKQAGMRLCNEIAALFKVGQVSLGWVHPRKKQVKIKAISNIETFDQRTHALWELESLMDEVVRQDAEILWQSSNEKSVGELVSMAHAAYGAVRAVNHLLSVPLRVGGDVVAVLTLESENTPFSQDDAWKIRLLLEQCAAHLALLEERSLWLGERAQRVAKRTFKTFFRLDKIGLKVAAIAGVLALGFVTFGTWDYRIDGQFTLKAQNVVHLSAPIDGILDQAPVRPGDTVKAGDVVMALSTRELLLEQARTFAELASHKHEIEKARASFSLADMRIAEAAQAVTEATLKQIQLRLESAQVKAPYQGVVIEGDLQARIGAPLRTGETFMKIAALDSFYVEILIAEKDLKDLTLSDTAALTFVGRPDFTYEAQADFVVPQAYVRAGGNVFALKASLLSTPEEWWRPGMSGLAKLPAGRRPIWWILTHEMIDYLRLNFWI